MPRRSLSSALLCALLLTLPQGPAVAQAADSIALHYHQRIPYEYLENGKVQGLVATPVERAFRKAGIPFHWVATPITRQFDLIQHNLGQDCAAGRFLNPERAQWARFSKPVYRNHPMGLLARSDNTALRQYTTLEQALKSPSMRLLVKSGYSYGPLIDTFIAQRKPAPLVTFDESQDMLRQIHRNMADAFVISKDEAVGLLASGYLPSADFTFLHFPDAPPPERRYIMCSFKVPPQVMDQLNAAIDFKDH